MNTLTARDITLADVAPIDGTVNRIESVGMVVMTAEDWTRISTFISLSLTEDDTYVPDALRDMVQATQVRDIVEATTEPLDASEEDILWFTKHRGCNVRTGKNGKVCATHVTNASDCIFPEA